MYVHSMYLPMGLHYVPTYVRTYYAFIPSRVRGTRTQPRRNYLINHTAICTYTACIYVSTDGIIDCFLLVRHYMKLQQIWADAQSSFLLCGRELSLAHLQTQGVMRYCVSLRFDNWQNDVPKML